MKLAPIFAFAVFAAPSVAQTFQPRGQLATSFLPYEELFAADLNGDGRSEFVARLSGGAGQGLDIWSHDGTGWGFQIIPGLVSHASLPAVEDFDGDGLDDIAVVTPPFASGTLKIFFGTTAPGLIEEVALDGVPIGSTDATVALDFDGDGDKDLVVRAASMIYVYRNEGGRVFTRVSTGAIPTIVSSLCAADLDGDGRDDLVLSRTTNSPLGWRRSLGGGDFETVQPLGGPGIPLAYEMHAADMDGDGDDDVVLKKTVSSIGGGERASSWVQISPGPQGTLRQDHLNGPNQGRPLGEVLDLDLDGVTDVVGFETGAPKLFFALGNGDGTFAPRETIDLTSTVFLYVFGTTAVDLDGDGDWDLVAGNLEWFENTSVASTRICPGEPNSVGPGATLFAAGSGVADVNSTVLNAIDLPPGSFGLFFTSLMAASPTQPPGSLGNLCLGGSLGRYSRPGEIRSADDSGTLRLRLDTDDVPDAMLGSVAIAAPEVRFFQVWYRDTVQGTATSNFTGAARVEFR